MHQVKTWKPFLFLWLKWANKWMAVFLWDHDLLLLEGGINAPTQWIKSQNMQYNAIYFNKVQKLTHTLKHLHYSPHWQMKLRYKNHVRCLLYSHWIKWGYLSPLHGPEKKQKKQKNKSLPTYDHSFKPPSTKIRQIWPLHSARMLCILHTVAPMQ